MRVDAFDFDLPEKNIALRPARPRDSARLLVIGPQDGSLKDECVGDLASFLEPGDVLVYNDTKVIPARLRGTRRRVVGGAHKDGIAEIEATLHKRNDASHWVAFCRPAKRLKPGDVIRFGDDLSAEVLSRDGGEVELAFSQSGPALDSAILTLGEMPLPPYIASKRDMDAQDAADYQTLFARTAGAVAAPTAGLHFTPAMMDSLAARGVETARVTLHVGAGTFLPVSVDETDDHKMHAEWGVVSQEVVDQLNAARARGNKVVAVGTTSLRLLESAARDGELEAWSGDTDIFITPGYKFNAVDILMTNFHLPKSTLFMLVSAFRSLDEMQAAYAHAISNDYRFYSYGDGCLISCANPSN